MCKSIKKFFHNCDYKTTEITHSNAKGEIWIQECSCGKKQQVLFNESGMCCGIIPLNDTK